MINISLNDVIFVLETEGIIIGSNPYHLKVSQRYIFWNTYANKNGES